MSVTHRTMEPLELFNSLESNQAHVVDDAKKKLQQTFNLTKESWLLNGMFDYYLTTNSARAIEILVSVREPHDKYLFDRLCEAMKGATKLQALTVLGHVLRKQPNWLHKITQHPLLRDLIRLLKTETDILPLLSALLVVVVLLPMIPALIGPYLQDIFEIFSRLVAWNCNPGKLAEEQLLHLQVTMYALFLRLYGMYPCNFLSYLRNHYRLGDNMPVFVHTVKPMLDTVKIHPHLVTASKDNETEVTRWKTLGHHDIIVDCEKFALDVCERSREDSCYMGLTSSFRSRSGTEHSQTLESLRCTGTLSTTDKDLWSPTQFFCMHSSSPPLPDMSAPASIPQTPNSQFMVSMSSFPHQEGTSPPEAAIEATPETTPIKDIHLSRPPPPGSNVPRALNSLNAGKWPGIPSGTSTPSHSQPSSPMKKEPSPFRFPNEGSAFEVSRKDSSLVSQKLYRMLQDRTQVNDSPLPTLRGKTPSLNPTSPLRVIPRHDLSVPDSPVPIETTVPIPGAKDWPVARPRPEKNGLRMDSPAVTDPHDLEDQEVLEIVQRGQHMHDTEQQSVRTQQCDSVLQEFQPSHDEEFDDCEQEHGSPCTSGGLHMPNSHSLQAFATRVHRLRYYSHCGPETVYSDLSDVNNTSTGSSPGQNTIQSATKVRRANSCPEMKKNHSAPVSESMDKVLNESDELNIEIQTKKSFLNGMDVTDERKPETLSTSTQTLDLWPMPYEHLFLGIFPLMEMNTEGKPSPSPSPAPSQHADQCNQKGFKFMPYDMLDRYIQHAASSLNCERDLKRVKGGSELEMRNLREQLGLVHLQLQYERHRREVHAVRNRRLLGESRNNKVLEEHNSALRDQLSLLQKEIEGLHDQLSVKKHESNLREKELQEVVSYWHEQCLIAQDENKCLKEQTEMQRMQLTENEKRISELNMEYQRAEANRFQLENDMKLALAQASVGERVRAELEHVQKELLLMGELNLKYQERLTQLPLLRNRDEELEHLSDAYHEEIKNFKQQLEQRNALIDSNKAHIAELERATQQHDDLCAGQKRMLKEVKEEYHERLFAVEKKYETQRAINKALEERTLDLWQRIEVLSKRPVQSPDTSSCLEAGVDRTSAAAGLSPHSSPLSASLASSEGSMAFLHSSASAAQDVREIKNLQVIVDRSECPATSASSSTLNSPSD